MIKKQTKIWIGVIVSVVVIGTVTTVLLLSKKKKDDTEQKKLAAQMAAIQKANQAKPQGKQRTGKGADVAVAALNAISGIAKVV